MCLRSMGLIFFLLAEGSSFHRSKVERFSSESLQCGQPAPSNRCHVDSCSNLQHQVLRSVHKIPLMGGEKVSFLMF